MILFKNLKDIDSSSTFLSMEMCIDIVYLNFPNIISPIVISFSPFIVTENQQLLPNIFKCSKAKIFNHCVFIMYLTLTNHVGETF